MNVEELKKALITEVPPTDTWLQNQYPAIPSKRYSSLTYLNYQNIEDCFGKDARQQIEKAVTAHPEIPVVILAALDKRGRLRGSRSVVQNEAQYYGHYELFACAANMEGFVEVFHNIKT